MNNNIICDLITRTENELYIGVVGPVRAGKSTFIRKFAETKLLPYLKDEEIYHKFQDELPQSAVGKTIMTVEPKFIPSNKVKISMSDDVFFHARLVDCVGYIIPSAKGYLNDDGSIRLVQTPWFSEQIPFHEAASIGTKKVIENHANIGILITSDGSFGEFTREEYEEIEQKIIDELQKLNKPFVIVINTTMPQSEQTQQLVSYLTEKYHNACLAVDINNMSEEDANIILKEALNEFDINELTIKAPDWISILDDNINFKRNFNDLISQTTAKYRKLKDVFYITDNLKTSGIFEQVDIETINPATGEVIINLTCHDSLYKSLLEEILGESINDKTKLLQIIQELSSAKQINTMLKKPLENAIIRGYDIAVPPISEMIFKEPEIIKQGNRYGIKIEARAKAILLNQIEIESSFEPIIGSEIQAKALIENMKVNDKFDIDSLMNLEIFGRKLSDVIVDGILSKVNSLDDAVLIKFNNSVEKVINYGKGGVICILV